MIAKRIYGSTQEQVSIIGFGAMRFAQPQDLDASAELVRYAHSKGINYFDTAPFYCGDRSEDIVGLALRTLPRDSYLVSTKCSESDGEALRASLERSLKRLGVEWIDFFHIWCLIRPEALSERIAGGAIAAAQRAKEEGLIRHLVVSVHLDGDDTAKVLETGLFEGLTIGYCAVNFPFRAKALDAALARRVGVVTMNPLGGGVIPRNAARLAFLRGPRDENVAQAALRFNLSHPAVTCALVGFSAESEVDEAVDAVAGFSPYPAEHIERLKANITESFDGLCTGCAYCLPCPAGLEIPKWMDAYNYKVFEGTDAAIRGRLKWHWSLSPDLAAECTACRQCEEACTQHLPISERLAAIAGLARGHRIDKEAELPLVGISIRVNRKHDSQLSAIPAFWERIMADGRFRALLDKANGNRLGICGVSREFSDTGEFVYSIAIDQPDDTRGLPDGWEAFTLPASTWAKFVSRGPLHPNLRETIQRVHQEWLPASGWSHADTAEVELYSDGDPKSAEYWCEYWVPLERRAGSAGRE